LDHAQSYLQQAREPSHPAAQALQALVEGIDLLEHLLVAGQRFDLGSVELLALQHVEGRDQIALDSLHRQRRLAQIVVDEQQQVLDVDVRELGQRGIGLVALVGPIHQPVACPRATTADSAFSQFFGVLGGSGGHAELGHGRRVAWDPSPSQIFGQIVRSSRSGATVLARRLQEPVQPALFGHRAATLAIFEIVGILGLGALWACGLHSAMAAIPEQIIERIRESVDIVDVVGGHVGLKRSGKQFKGLCPFHDEKSPSFYVDPVRRSFKCFGCGAWGDVFDFVQKVEGVGFLAAVRTLGTRVGVALPDQTSDDVRRAEAREREREIAYRVNAAATELYRRILLESPIGEAGRAYERERGIEAQVAESFAIGYAPAPAEAGWDVLVRELEARKLPLDVAEALGLVVRSPKSGSFYDRFRGRLMFPIIQPGGRVLGFSGRILPAYAQTDDGQKTPKYVNSPESVLYKKGRTLFGLHVAGASMRQRERGILVEGQVDVVAMHQRGFTETVAPLGTALTKPQCELLARFTSTIVLCFDGDQAGAKAAYAALPLLLEEGMDVRIAPLQPGEDPDSTPPEQLEKLLHAPGSALEWLMKRMVAKGARQSIDAKGKALRALVPLLRVVRGRDVRGDYAHLAAEMLQIPAQRVWAAIESSAASPRTSTNGEQQGGPNFDIPRSRPQPSADSSQFSAGMTHSAAMRPVQPLPSGQASVTALLVDRPELARVAEREGVLDRVTDQRLRPIVARVIRAALDGQAIPSEGELLELVDSRQHRLLHDRVFGHEYLEVEDPQAALEEGLVLCERDHLEHEVRKLEQHIAEARSRGDLESVNELVTKRWAARGRLAELQASLQRA
jgi:DNA primase